MYFNFTVKLLHNSIFPNLKIRVCRHTLQLVAVIQCAIINELSFDFALITRCNFDNGELLQISNRSFTNGWLLI